MYFADLQSFLRHLDEIDELVKVRASVDPYLEVAAIVDQVCKGAGDKRALLFEDVKGSQIPLAINLFGSQQRVAMAFGVAGVEVLASRIRSDLANWKGIDSAQALAGLTHNDAMARLSSGVSPCFAGDVVKEGLDGLPALHAWPGDGGRYLTLGQIFTRHPESSRQNCGMYRVQLLDKKTALMRCHSGSGCGAHLAAWHAQGKAMPVAIVLGGPPVLTWCAGVPLPDQVSEFAFAGYLTGQTIAAARCQYSDLHVPATSEIVIEGHILPGEEKTEGPFGNHTGYYSPAAPAPMIRVTSVLMRDHAVYPCTLVGPPPMENMYLAEAAERLLLPLLQHDDPWITDIHMPLTGIYHGAAIISVDAPEISLAEISKALREKRLLRNSRLIILFDKDCDLHNAANVYWRFINSASWVNSVLIEEDKMTIDARTVAQRAKIHPDRGTLDKVMKRWHEFSLGDL